MQHPLELRFWEHPKQADALRTRELERARLEGIAANDNGLRFRRCHLLHLREKLFDVVNWNGTAVVFALN